VESKNVKEREHRISLEIREYGKGKTGEYLTLSYAGMTRIRFMGQRLRRVFLSAGLIRLPKVFHRENTSDERR
jgi:hypothetical protein